MGLKGTAEKLEAWRRGYNEERPHSAIGKKAQAAPIQLPDASTPSAGLISGEPGADWGNSGSTSMVFGLYTNLEGFCACGSIQVNSSGSNARGFR